MRQIIDATQIDRWFISTKRDAQELLPHLVRKLIVETVRLESLRSIRIPVGDQIGLPDYDGRVETIGEHLYVPMGRSVWEMGTGNPEDKADADIRNRIKDPMDIDPTTTVFVFVTPHRWDRKDDWTKKWKKQGPWSDVRVIDYVDLTSWLELAPGAAFWFAHQIGVPVQGLWDLEAFTREELDDRYGVQLPPQLLIGGRDAVASELQSWIDSDSREIRVEGESVEEVSAFIAAVMHSLPDQKKEMITSLLLFVNRAEILDYLSSLQTAHFIVTLTPEVRRRARAINSPSLRIIVLYARSAGSAVYSRQSLKLGPVRRDPCEQALVGMGFPSPRARRIAQESKGSLTAILWMIAEEQDAPLPWARGESALELVPLVLAGQWSADNKEDQEAVGMLASRKYEEIERIIAKWTAPEGPFIRRGPIWDWLAWDYAWACLAPFIERAQIDRFCEVAKKVLGTPDPSLELAPDKRWAADIYDKRHPYSSTLRTGLVGSIVQLALHSQEVKGLDGQTVANALVSDLLDGEKLPRRASWLSVVSWLPDLAEAAPDSFLATFDRFLDDKDAVTAFFEEGGFLGRSPHVYLLWALERLSWSKDHLTRITLLLGDLAALDPGGQISNRPASSLTAIFLPWYPQNTASVRDRLDAIDALYQRQPEVAWKFADSLLPGEARIAMPTNKPQWRPWRADEETKVTNLEFWQFIEELVNRMIKWAGNSGPRLAKLVKSYTGLWRKNSELGERILSSLRQIDPKDLKEADRVALTESLRKVLSWHREVPDTESAINEEELKPLDELYNKFQPENPMEQYTWLFTSWPDLPSGRDRNYEKRTERVMEEREKAVRAIYEALGLDGLTAFAEKVERPDEIGSAFAKLDIDERVESNFLMLTLSMVATRESVPAPLRMGWGYVGASYFKRGDVWIERVINLEGISWDANGYANLALGLPAEGPTWDLLAKWGENAENYYWLRTSIYYIREPERDGERVIRRLLQAGKPYRALDVASMCIRKVKRGEIEIEALPISKGLILEVLQEAPRHNPIEEWYPPAGSVGYHVESLLDILEKEGVEASVLASLEWAWMPVLEHGRRGLKALQNALSMQPGLFVEALKLVFRAENEEHREVSQEDRARATQAYRLLEEWKRVPGAIGEQLAEKESGGDITFKKGRVDEEALFQWVREARKLARQCGRLSVCDSRIGNVLAYAPEDPDGKWPCEPVRKLIEDLCSERLEGGLEIGIHNKRGVHWRAKGGGQERKLAAKFHSFADQVRSKWPRTAAVLKRTAENFEREARREDERDSIQEFE